MKKFMGVLLGMILTVGFTGVVSLQLLAHPPVIGPRVLRLLLHAPGAVVPCNAPAPKMILLAGSKGPTQERSSS